MSKLEDIYILALQYAENKESFNLGELATALNLTPNQKNILALQIDRKEIFLHNQVVYFKHTQRDFIELFFTVSDKFRLLSHAELEEARLSANSASKYATYALIISIAAAMVSSVLSLIQIKSDISLPEHTTKTLENINQSLLPINQNINKIIEQTEAPTKIQQYFIIQNTLPYFPTQAINSSKNP
ncbi:hypothetical protein [Pseudomonas fluorescens]|uniref:hypothetical protein n=1 Tax=Pseudomonas fluorescens TaxID=294 RepID=UPI000937875E|nr:hypothetical protein [Pseudomonas fluorescens]